MKEFESLIKKQLAKLGINPETEGLEETPERFLKAFGEFTEFHRNKKKIDRHFVFFPIRSGDQLVVISGIFFSSLCEHHLLPFFGSVDIGYVPNGKILGISKFKRILEVMTKQITVQERLTQDIFDLFMGRLEPKGLIVHIKATHTCALVRGARDTNSIFNTFVKSGFFDKHASMLVTFLHMVDKNES
ncbi:MAG: GTP cyclohydrolase I FolE [Candidatus Aenigmarchaeota archaeon]|nr:GTP cyclohydrolase I FolE [Candidatus Aenigmarchaeota archaeon]